MKCRALFGLAMLVAVVARADTVGAGLDLVLLVDRSGSIGAADRSVENDLVELTLTMLARSALEERVHHRLGVVSFGSMGRIDLPLSVVDQPALQAIRITLASIDSRRSLGNTNFPAACNLAAEMFADAGGQRRRSILLITDGRSYVPGVPNGEIMQRLQRIISSKLAPATTVDVLILGSESDSESWRRLPGVQIQVARGRSGALATLHRDIGDLLGTPGERREIHGMLDTIEIPPYLDLVVFDIVRNPTADNEVSVFAPGARQPLDAHAPGVEEVRLGDAVFTLAVHRPSAGLWTFRTSSATSHVRVLMQQFFPRGLLVEPDPRSPLRRHERAAVAYQLVDPDGATLHELPAFPLSVDLTLARPDARRIPVPMKRTTLPGLYRAEPAECELSGRYWTEVVVSTNVRGRAVRVFEDRWSGFSVLPYPVAGCCPNASAQRVTQGPERPRSIVAIVAAAFALFTLLMLVFWRWYVARRQTWIA